MTESTDAPVQEETDTTAKPRERLTIKEATLNVGRFFRFLGVRVVLNIIFIPIVAVILVGLGFLWTSTFGLPGNIVTTTPLVWMPLQLLSLAILGGLMWGAMETARRFLCRLGLPLQAQPGRFLRLLTIGGWLLGSLGIGRLAAFGLPLVQAWNLPMWLALFVGVELLLYFAIELTLCRLFPRFKKVDDALEEAVTEEAVTQT